MKNRYLLEIAVVGSNPTLHICFGCCKIVCMKRTCKKCDYVGDVQSFPLANTLKGVEYRRHICVKCCTKNKKARLRTIRESYYAIKKAAQCADCGNDDFRVLEFDHIDQSTKSFNVSDGLSRGYLLAALLTEIKKCRVLCANCHRIRTWIKQRP